MDHLTDAIVLALVLLPVPLLAIAWSKSRTFRMVYVVVTLSAVLLISAGIPSAKVILLGGDYSDRLDTTIGLNLLLAVIVIIHSVIKHNWIVVGAAVILLLDWYMVLSINSVV